MSPSDETVWRAIDGATVLQQGSHCVALRAIEGATVLQQVMREKGKLEDVQIKQQHLRQASNNCTATGFALIRCGSISMRKTTSG